MQDGKNDSKTVKSSVRGSEAVESIIREARREGRVGHTGLVLCEFCDNPASLSLSLEIGTAMCAPCCLGEADSYDDSDLITVSAEMAEEDNG